MTYNAVKAAEITWTMKRTTPHGEFVLVYKGKVDGKTMGGTTETPMGAGEWKAEILGAGGNSLKVIPFGVR